MEKKGWMAKQVAETQSALSRSPEWMLKIARFEGSDRHEIVQGISTEQKSAQLHNDEGTSSDK
jgi:hypothetical protein